ncbi:MAG: mechanosensitive ion channel [Betaproteobacteria bacterium]|nr:mechanosensitive ion channel [Betaproteobacteria bacterium]
MTGLLPELVSSLEDAKLSIGKQEITLRQILEAALWACVTVFVALSVSRIVEQRIMATASIDMSSRVVISKFVRALATTLAILIALPLVGIPLSLLSVFGGALGVGLGLGLQKIVSNYVSGFIILLDRSIQLGNLISIEDRQGVVIGIKSRYTVVRALDGTEAIIPNDVLITNTVINHTYSDPAVAIRIGVTISYDSDLNMARKIMQTAAESHSRILDKPSPITWLKQLGDNGIELELAAWINDPDQGQAILRSDLLLRILHEFRTANIAIPYPQREVRIIATPDLHQSSEMR